MRSNIFDVTDADFNTEVIEHKGIVIVDFYADWCAPCKNMSLVLERFSEKHDDVKIAKVNVDIAVLTAARYGVRTLPTLLVFDYGELKETAVGMRNLLELEQMVGIER